MHRFLSYSRSTTADTSKREPTAAAEAAATTRIPKTTLSSSSPPPPLPTALVHTRSALLIFVLRVFCNKCAPVLKMLRRLALRPWSGDVASLLLSPAGKRGKMLTAVAKGKV